MQESPIIVCGSGGYAAVRETKVEWATDTFMPAGLPVASTLASSISIYTAPRKFTTINLKA
jgi:hypothetical protein